MRVFVKDGDLEGSTKALKEGFRAIHWPKQQATKQKILDLSGKQFNTIHAKR
jgi:hypothetical protein